MRVITIDFRIWTTQAKYAKQHKVSAQLVRQWVKRGNLETMKIPELNNLVLVKK